MSAAEKLGYSPNPFARSLITGRSGLVGVVVGDTRYPFFLTALDLLSRRLSAAGRFMLTTTTDSLGVDAEIERFLTYRIEGLVLISATLSPNVARRCIEAGVRIVTFKRTDIRATGVVSVIGENQQGGCAIAGHLLSQGYKRLAVMLGEPTSLSSRERVGGFIEHLARVGVAAPVESVGHYQRETAISATRELLDARRRPDAIFCANDDMAFAAIEVARYEYGLEIGREIGIAGFDDVGLSSWPSFDLTSYSLPIESMIDDVLEALLLPKSSGVAEQLLVVGSLQVRSSTERSGRPRPSSEADPLPRLRKIRSV